MATTKICDRCGAVINPQNSWIYIIYGTGGYRIGEVEAKDLCCSCALALKKFLSNEKYQKGYALGNGT